MKSSERFALNQHLSFYPNDEDFQGILQIIRGKKQGKVTPWQPFCELEPKELVMMIANMSATLEQHFIATKDLVTVIDVETVTKLMKHHLGRMVDRGEAIRVCGYLDSLYSLNLPSVVLEALSLMKIK